MTMVVSEPTPRRSQIVTLGSAAHHFCLLRTRHQIRNGLGALLLVAIAACDRSPSRSEGNVGPLVMALRREPIELARWGVQFSVPSTPEGCWESRVDTLFDISCRPRQAIPNASVATIAGRAATGMRTGIDVDAIHASALLDLTSGDAVGISLDRSISYLEMATQLAPQSSSAFSDLAAAHLVAAERRSDAFELLQALDAASRAVELDPANEAARFNRALSLDLLALDGEATKEWRRYLQRDSTSAWASRGLRFLTRVQTRQPAGTTVLPPFDTWDTAIGTFARQHPFEARAFAWERLLGGWGEAVITSDSSRAAAHLNAASVVSNTLAATFGDSSIALALRSIAASRSPARRTRLAHLHATFASALGRTRVNDHVHADSAYVAIMSDPNASPVLRQWATYAHANALVYQQRNEEALAAAGRVLGEIDEQHQPSLAGRAWWLTGMARLRLGDNDAGLQAVNQARRAFEAGGERENLLGATGVAGEVALRTGDDMGGYAGLHAALRGLREYPTGIWRHNVLYVLSGRATSAELDRAAQAIESEDFAASVAANRSASIVEARLARARSLWGADDTVRARAAIDTAAREIALIPVAGVRSRFQAELNLTLATGPLRDQRERAFAMLDSVVAFYTPVDQTKRPDAAKLVPALIARADAALALARIGSAESDLQRAARIYEEQRDSLSSLPLRAALLARARSAFESLVKVRLAQGRVVDALNALERNHAFASRVRDTTSGLPAIGGGQTVLDYAMIGDTLFAWQVDSTGVSLARTAVGRRRLAEVLAATRAGFELGASDSTLRPLLTQLFEWFVRPVENRIGAGKMLVVVADPDLASVPVAALFDARRESYLVESHAIRFASTLSEGAKAAPVTAPPTAAVFVASPDVDPNEFPSLAELQYSQAEVQASAALYPQAKLAVGAGVDSVSIVAALSTASVFHFAGHALFDDARPDRSRLVVRPRGVSAAAISTLDLRRLRLVVLSACESMRISEHRGSGFAGVAESFLAAGAGGVIGSSWRVNDASTAELMRGFHTSYTKSGDAADALRTAQLVLLRSASVALRTPAAWAAFRYAGN
jgi:CHAT domain-containing protein